MLLTVALIRHGQNFQWCWEHKIEAIKGALQEEKRFNVSGYYENQFNYKWDSEMLLRSISHIISKELNKSFFLIFLCIGFFMLNQVRIFFFSSLCIRNLISNKFLKIKWDQNRATYLNETKSQLHRKLQKLIIDSLFSRRRKDWILICFWGRKKVESFKILTI